MVISRDFVVIYRVFTDELFIW